MRILVVDDDEEVLELLRIFAETKHFEVETATNGLLAMEKFIENRPDIVFLDVMIPGKDGLVVLQEMVKIDSKGRYIMITAYKDAEKIVKAYRNGAIDCLLKPINFDYLGQLLDKIQNEVPAESMN